MDQKTILNLLIEGVSQYFGEVNGAIIPPIRGMVIIYDGTEVVVVGGEIEVTLAGHYEDHDSVTSYVDVTTQ
jgi:hypothetical protein